MKKSLRNYKPRAIYFCSCPAGNITSYILYLPSAELLFSYVCAQFSEQQSSERATMKWRDIDTYFPAEGGRKRNTRGKKMKDYLSCFLVVTIYCGYNLLTTLLLRLLLLLQLIILPCLFSAEGSCLARDSFSLRPQKNLNLSKSYFLKVQSFSPARFLDIKFSSFQTFWWKSLCLWSAVVPIF